MILIKSQHSFQKCKKRSSNWFARSPWENFQYFTKFWIQQCKQRNQPDQGLLTAFLVGRLNKEPIFMEEANQFVSFKLHKVKSLKSLNIVTGATNKISSLKNYKTKKQPKCYFPTINSKTPRKWTIQYFPFMRLPKKLKKLGLFEKVSWDFAKLIDNGSSNEYASAKMKVFEKPLCGAEDYRYRETTWTRTLRTFQQFLR